MLLGEHVEDRHWQRERRKRRLPVSAALARRGATDIVCLQELKSLGSLYIAKTNSRLEPKFEY